MPRLVLAALFALWVGVGKSDAHEFWIAPEAYRAAVGDSVRADLRLGDAFVGVARSYAPEDFERFEVVTAEGAIPIDGSDGDVPALNAADLPEGLAVIVHQSVPLEMTWDSWGSFAAFAEYKGLGDVATMQAERGLSRTDLRQADIRYARSLVAIGHGQVHHLTGVAAPMPLVNVDTDMIIPKQFLKTIKRSGSGKNLFDEMRYDRRRQRDCPISC
jgi:hypothetical protein